MTSTPTVPSAPAVARRLVTPDVAHLFLAEISNEANGGVAPATLSSTIDSIAQGLPFPDGTDVVALLANVLVIRDLLPGHTPVADLLD